ncbi:MAG: TorF family putative porin [Holophagaceae bacterium]|nr:TorF family putative porin [Holophagaceae bacterium]
MHQLRILSLCSVLANQLLAQAPAPPAAPPPPAPPSILGFTLTGSTTVGSQYIFRGLTQTDGKPTVQAELDLVHPTGFYASAAFSNISWITDQFIAGPVSAGIEVDLFGGYKWGFAKDWTLDIGAYRYLYPGDYKSLAGYNPNTTEAYLGLAYSWASLKYSRVVSGGNFGIAQAEGSTYVDLSVAIPLGESGWTVLAHGGKTTFKTSDAAINDLLDYMDYKLGITKEIKGYMLTLAGTNADTKDAGYRNALGRNIGKDRVTFTIAKTF